jgi:zinc protease
VLLADPNRVNTDLPQLQAVTAADVQRVMKKYFTAANRLVIYYLPKAKPATSHLDKPDDQAQRIQGGQGR